jgi:hypothetical protein
VVRAWLRLMPRLRTWLVLATALSACAVDEGVDPAETQGSAVEKDEGEIRALVDLMRRPGVLRMPSSGTEHRANVFRAVVERRSGIYNAELDRRLFEPTVDSTLTLSESFGLSARGLYRKVKDGLASGADFEFEANGLSVVFQAHENADVFRALESEVCTPPTCDEVRARMRQIVFQGSRLLIVDTANGFRAVDFIVLERAHDDGPGLIVIRLDYARS